MANALLYLVEFPVVEVRVRALCRYVAPSLSSPSGAVEVRSRADLWNLTLAAMLARAWDCRAVLVDTLIDHLFYREFPVDYRVIAGYVARVVRPRERVHARNAPVRFTVVVRDRLWKRVERELNASGTISARVVRAEVSAERAVLPEGLELEGRALYGYPRSDWDYVYSEIPREPACARGGARVEGAPRSARLLRGGAREL